MSARGLVLRWAVGVAAAAVVGGLVAGGATAGAATSAGALNVRISELPAGVSARVTVSDGRQDVPRRWHDDVARAPGSVRDRRPLCGVESMGLAPLPDRFITAGVGAIGQDHDGARRLRDDRAGLDTHAASGRDHRPLRLGSGSTDAHCPPRHGMEYRVGDAIVAGASRPAPDGLIVRVARVIKRARRTIVFGVQPATLAQALPRTLIDANVPAAAAAATLELGCGNSATATISASLSVSVHARLETGGRRPHLTAASFQLSPTGKTGVAVTTAADGTCTVTRSTGSDGRAVTVHAGPVPIVLVPRASTRAAIGGGYGSGITASELQTVTGTVRVELPRQDVAARRSSRPHRQRSA